MTTVIGPLSTEPHVSEKVDLDQNQPLSSDNKLVHLNEKEDTKKLSSSQISPNVYPMNDNSISTVSDIIPSTHENSPTLKDSVMRDPEIQEEKSYTPTQPQIVVEVEKTQPQPASTNNTDSVEPQQISPQLSQRPITTEAEPILVNPINDGGCYEDVENSPGFINYVGICISFVTSYCFCLFGLSYLLTCALFSIMKKKYLYKKSNKKNKIKPPKYPKLDKINKKLKPLFKYYVEAQGYKVEEYKVETDDGFIIDMQHLINPNDTPEMRAKRYPVMMLHGLMQSAFAYATSGEKSLAFFLLESGYDVWLANNRNGFNPKHKNYNYLNIKLWSWRIRELGTRDLPALINFVLEKTGSEKLALVAHSQGTTQTFLALSKGYIPELGNKISAFVALAPAVYGGRLLDRYFLRWVKHLNLKTFRLFFGHHGFFSIMMQLRGVIPYNLFCYCGHIMFSYLFEWNDYLWNKRYRSRQFIFSPVYVSAELMYWWVGKGGFADRGCIFQHESPDHSWFDSQLPPVCIVVPDRDELVNPHKLVDRFEQVECRLQPSIKAEVVRIPEYSHVDVLWAADTCDRVGAPMRDFIWKYRHEQPDKEWNEPRNLNSS